MSAYSSDPLQSEQGAASEALQKLPEYWKQQTPFRLPAEARPPFCLPAVARKHGCVRALDQRSHSHKPTEGKSLDKCAAD